MAIMTNKHVLWLAVTEILAVTDSVRCKSLSSLTDVFNLRFRIHACGHSPCLLDPLRLRG